MTSEGKNKGVTRRAALAGAAALGGAAMLPKFAFAAESVLRVAAYVNPSTLDPATGRSGGDQAMLWPMFDTLIDIDFATLKPVPRLAKSWTFRDPTTLALDLVEGVKYHDGVAMDAETVKFNFQHMMTNPASTVKGEISTVKEVVVESPTPHDIKLTQPDASILLNLSDRPGMMSSPKAIQAAGADYDRKPVGTGAWKFVSWADADNLIMTRNENYWRKGLPKIDRLEFKIITDTNTGLRSVVAGQNDMVYRVSPQQIAAIDRNARVIKNVAMGLYAQQFYFNRSRAPMDNKALRQAINYAIDRESYTKVITAGLGEPANLSVPKAHWSYDEQAAARYPHDPDKAKALLKQAGLENIEIHACHYSDQRSVQRMEVIVAQLEKVGIKCKLTTGAVAQLNKIWNDGVGDILLSAWTGRADPSNIFTQMFLAEGYYNKGGTVPPDDLKKAILDSLASDDLDKRKAALARAARLERENAMYAPLCFEPEVVVHSPKVKGFVPTLIGKPRFDDMSIDA